MRAAGAVDRGAGARGVRPRPLWSSRLYTLHPFCKTLQQNGKRSLSFSRSCVAMMRASKEPLPLVLQRFDILKLFTVDTKEQLSVLQL